MEKLKKEIEEFVLCGKMNWDKWSFSGADAWRTNGEWHFYSVECQVAREELGIGICDMRVSLTGLVGDYLQSNMKEETLINRIYERIMKAIELEDYVTPKYRLMGAGFVIDCIKRGGYETLYIAVGRHGLYATINYNRVNDSGFFSDYLLTKVIKDSDVSAFTPEYLEELYEKAAKKKAAEYGY